MLQKFVARPGLNREGTNYANEGGYYDGDKIRFRSGFCEKLGGWTQVSPFAYDGTCRSIWTWADGDQGAGAQYIGLGTSSKYYIYYGGIYNDITPIAQTNTLTNPFSVFENSNTVTVFDNNYEPVIGDSVIFSGATAVGGITIEGEYKITNIPGTNSLLSPNTYTIESEISATSTTTGGGTVTADYEYPIGSNVYKNGTGWGSGPWGGVIFPTKKLLGANPFAAVSGSNILTITLTNHGVTDQAYVAFQNATGFENIPGSTLNATYLATVTGVNTFTVPMPSGFTSNATASGGGNSVRMTIQTGEQGWGDSYSSGIGQQLRLWSNDNYGADLVIAPRGGPVFYWSDFSGVNTRAKYISDLADETTLIVDASTFVSGTKSITVTGANAPYIYPYMVITGVGIPAGTQVASTYLTGSTTVPITTTTTSASSGNYSYSYVGSYVPIATYQVVTSAIQEFIICFGSNPYVPGVKSGEGISAFDPLLVRWSDQGNAYQWVPQVTNQSGEYLLTNGSFIMGARYTRQEILVWTDSCLYSMQYLGAPYVWGFQVLMNNITVISPNCMVTVNNVTYWMGRDRFYMYTGRVEVLPCSLRQYIFGDINQSEAYQIFAGTNEAYNEVWWYYVSESSGGTDVDKYVIYNYLDRVWYYGSLNRTAWLQAGTLPYPIAATFYTTAAFTASIETNMDSETIMTVTSVDFGTLAVGQLVKGEGVAPGTVIESGPDTGNVGTYKVNNPQTVSQESMTSTDGRGILLNHEDGNDDLSTFRTLPIYSYVQSSDFDIGDGNNFGFVWRILPDVNFNGSTVNNPSVTMTVKPRENSGTMYTKADSPVVTSRQDYTRIPQYTIQEFTGQVYTRIRGRQMAFRIESSDVGVAWQLGAIRLDVKPDARR